MKITRLKTIEMRAAGLDAMTKTQDTLLDETEAVAVCSLGLALCEGLYEGGTETDDQASWIMCAIRAAYLAGKERRGFAGYG